MANLLTLHFVMHNAGTEKAGLEYEIKHWFIYLTRYEKLNK